MKSNTSNHIRLLTEQVANQIAAGEVVERPASVVKELVENALDARSTRISVEIQAGGRSLIRVTDNGTGMSRDDALLCLERHATSKIQRAEDLASVMTMGFRGEAMPSIASVSRMILTTLEQDSDDEIPATQVVINGGKIGNVLEAGAPHGTSVEVRRLFYNLPARRKFLRSEETEYTHIYHYLTLAALAHPEVAFTFVRDGRPIWRLPAVVVADGDAGKLAALRERMRALSGLGDELVPVDYSVEVEVPVSGLTGVEGLEDEEDSLPTGAIPTETVRVWGMIGKPGLSRSSRQDQHLFVNQRPIENRALSMALQEGYHTALMKGRYPVCCLFLEVNPSRVDVNIHPAKREVKFHNQRAMQRLLAQAVRQALLDYHGEDKGRSPLPGHSSPFGRDDSTQDLPHLASSDPAPGAGPATEAATPMPVQETTPLPLVNPEAERMGVSKNMAPVPQADSIVAPAASSGAPEVGSAAQLSSESHQRNQPLSLTPSGLPPGDITPLLKVPLRLLGVVGKLYVVLESDQGLVLMDQHAAHERILFEQMLQRMELGKAPSQGLLLPETVELSVRDAQFVKDQLDTLNHLGVGLSEFGERTYMLDALPPFVKVSEPRTFILELIDELKSVGQDINSHRLGEHVVAKTVCRHAVKANDSLAEPELEKLLEDLRHCRMPYTCPHGRPTLIEMSFKELEKKFGRVV